MGDLAAHGMFPIAAIGVIITRLLWMRHSEPQGSSIPGRKRCNTLFRIDAESDFKLGVSSAESGVQRSKIRRRLSGTYNQRLLMRLPPICLIRASRWLAPKDATSSLGPT